MDELIYVLKDGQKKGPFDRRAAQSMVDNAMLSADDPAWHEGLSSWLPLGDVLGPKEPHASGSPPPPPLSVAPPLDSQSGGGVDYRGKVLTAFVLPFIGLCLVPFGWLIRIIGLLLIFLGSYNAVLCLAGTRGRPWKRILGILAVAANVVYVLIAVGMIASVNSETGNQSHQSSGKSATIAAWKAMNAALQVASSNGSDIEKLDRMSRMLSEVQITGVDEDLVAHLKKLYSIVARIQDIETRMLTEAQKIQQDTQAGGFVLGAIFGAAAAQRSNDPVNDSLRGGLLGGAFANEIGNAAMRDLEARYLQEFSKVYDELVVLERERTGLASRLSARYGRGL